MRSVRGEKIFKLLETISTRETTSDDLINGLLLTAISRYQSPQKLNYEVRMARKRRLSKATERVEKIRIQKLLYYLKEDGLIENKKSFLKLTKAGYEKFAKLKTFFLRKRVTDNQQSITKDYLKICIFDIPETKRGKRESVRVWLKALNYEMIQKSVWIGEGAIPQEFIDSIRDWKLIPYIKIFSVHKEGNIFF